MKAAIYNPYLDTLGGGERYTLGFAKALAERGYIVDVEWKDRKIKDKLERRFGINLGNINIVNDIKRGDGYDICFWVSDGSIPLLHARKNILHFQVPFHDVKGKSLMNKMKFIRINTVVCNSEFTKSVIDREYGIKSTVIYPPVDTENIKPKRKENLILFVGRFSELKQNKGQDILVNTFKKMCAKGLVGWKLILAGGTEIGTGNALTNLEKLIKGYPAEIIKSPDYKQLKELYGKARIFWSASGFGENEEKNPEKVEHFGITVVEAMAGGAVPVICASGGHKEIVNDGINGFLWNNTSKLIKITDQLINDPDKIRRISKEAIKKSKSYDNIVFKEKVFSLIK